MLTLHWLLQLNLNTDVTTKLTSIAEDMERHLWNKTKQSDRSNTINTIRQNTCGQGVTCYKVGAKNILCQLYYTASVPKCVPQPFLYQTKMCKIMVKIMSAAWSWSLTAIPDIRSLNPATFKTQPSVTKAKIQLKITRDTWTNWTLVAGIMTLSKQLQTDKAFDKAKLRLKNSKYRHIKNDFFLFFA